MKLFDLYEHLKAAKIAKPEQIACEIESAEIDPSFACVTQVPGGAVEGLTLYRHKYTGRIGLDKAFGDLAHVLALCVVWMREHGGDDQQNRFLGYVGEPVDDRLSDIDLRFEFEEAVQYIPAEPGYAGKDKITWDGLDWKRATPVPSTAELPLEPIIASLE